ncbi:29491_t:CDS:2, partial [Gigaspora margarita]
LANYITTEEFAINHFEANLIVDINSIEDMQKCLIILRRYQKQQCLKEIEILKSILSQNAFFGHGPNLGPIAFLKDNSSSEHNAL